MKYNNNHQASVTHEVLGGAVAYEVWPHFSFFIDVTVLTDILQAAKAYENHCAENGRPDSHAKAKEILYILSYFVGEVYLPSIQGRFRWCLR
jgi:hypothetical protein